MGEIALIGGSGLYNINGVKRVQEHVIETPFGAPSAEVIECELNGQSFFFLARHGKGHTKLPHEVNYRANIYALKTLGVKYLFSVSAVGSLKEEHNPRKFVLPSQFIDWTKGQRARTFFGDGVIAHVSVAEPIDHQLQNIARLACQEAGITHSTGGTYVCIEGPQFSTKAESAIYRNFGADVIGMTNVPEAFLAKEAGIAYATIAMVTDYDCWKDEHCNVEEILKVMSDNGHAAHQLVQKLIPLTHAQKFDVDTGNSLGILTPLDSLSDEKRQLVELLLK